MKALNKIKVGILGLSVVLIFSTNGFGNSDKGNKTKLSNEKRDVVLQGTIAHRRANVEEIRVNVYSKNELVESAIANGKGDFEMKLQRGEDYTIEIVANGFYNKRFKVLTTGMDIDGTPPPIEFNATLVHKNELSGSDDFLLDFPWAIFTFHGKKKEFKLHQKYTKKMIKDINAIYHATSSIN